MTEQFETPAPAAQPSPAEAGPSPTGARPVDDNEPPRAAPAPAGPGSAGPGSADSGSSGPSPAELIQERPEVAVGAAFAGGLVLALILKRLGR